METNDGARNEKEAVSAKPVKEIVEPTAPVETKASAETVVDHFKAHGSVSTPVIDSEGTLVGKLSTDGISRGIIGRGHDPKVTSVEPEVEKEGEPYCNENESISGAEQTMHELKLEELSVVSDEKKLVGKATIARIEDEKKRERE